MSAHASPPVEARRLSDEGRAAHDRGDYEQATTTFAKAYVIAPSPALLFNLAQAYRLWGRCEDASKMYRNYLDSGAVEARALAEAHLATVERCVRDARRIEINDALDYQHVPLPSIPPTIVAPADPTRRSPPQAAVRSERLTIGGAAAVIGGTVALGIAVGYGLRAHRAGDDVERAYLVGGEPDGLAARDAEGRRAATAARIFGAGGGLAVATGVTLLILGRRERAVPLAITPSPSSPRVSYTWQF